MNAKYLPVVFFRAASGNEPVREWLRTLAIQDRRSIGEDIKTVQFGWPLGMPLIRKIEPGLWEVRTRLVNRAARVVFTVSTDHIVLLHGFIKKSPKLPEDELHIARQRLGELKRG